MRTSLHWWQLGLSLAQQLLKNKNHWELYKDSLLQNDWKTEPKSVLKKATAQRLRGFLFDDQGKHKPLSHIPCEDYDIDEGSYHLCLRCRSISVDKIIFTSNGVGSWHHKWQEVKICAEKSCALCRYLVEFFKAASFSDSRDSSMPKDNDHFRIEWETGFNVGYLIQAARLMAKAKQSPYYQGPHGVPISYRTGPSDDINYWACPMYVLDRVYHHFFCPQLYLFGIGDRYSIYSGLCGVSLEFRLHKWSTIKPCTGKSRYLLQNSSRLWYQWATISANSSGRSPTHAIAREHS